MHQAQRAEAMPGVRERTRPPDQVAPATTTKQTLASAGAYTKPRADFCRWRGKALRLSLGVECGNQILSHFLVTGNAEAQDDIARFDGGFDVAN